MAKGDRIKVRLRHNGPRGPKRTTEFNGIIVSEGRGGKWWNVLKDGTKYPRGIHKSFCKPEGDDDQSGG